MTRRCALALLAVLVGISAACSGKSPASTEKPKQYAMRGVVVKLSPDNNLATIDGENIAGWMKAMKMEYPVEDKSEYLALHKGEKITATVNVTSEGFWLTNVKERKD